MLKAYALRGGDFVSVPVRGAADLTEDILWVDLLDPTPLELQYLRSAYGQGIDHLEELVDSRASARVFADEKGLHLNSYFLRNEEGIHRNVTVGFTLHNGRLLTLRDVEVDEFMHLRYGARHDPRQASSAAAILCGLFELRVMRLGDALARLQSELEGLSRSVFSTTETNMTLVLARLARIEDTNGKARLSLLDNRRTLSVLSRNEELAKAGESNRVQATLGDIDSLLSDCAFIFDKTGFLTNSAIGTISIQQNNIIKLFSVAAVMFLPPTLVASIYGMNFRHMPELEWMAGYPMSLVLMALAAIVPYLLFKKKGWL